MNTASKSFAVAAAATGALLAASGAPALGTPQLTATLIPTPSLHVVASKGGLFKVTGSRTFSAGRVTITLRAKKGEQETAVMRLHKGYTMAKFNKDFGTFFASADNPTPAGIKAINRIVRRTTFYGGLDSGTGHNSVSGSFVLPKAGTYYLLNDSDQSGGSKPVKLHVTPKAGSRASVAVSAHVTAVNAKRWRGSTNLPASGTIKVTNAATNSPHFLSLQHVKTGTTRKDVIKAFQCGGPSCPPPPFLQGSAGTDVLHMGKSQTLTYTLPAGDYVEACFFPDLKTGMPHAFMGMVRIVHLS